MRLLISALLLTACARHDGGQVEVDVEDCVLCHQDEFDSATDPVLHVGVLPPEACISCHDTTVWIPSIFTHQQMSIECAACHMRDYEQTSAPVHSGMFPTTCGDCHLTTAWQPALEGAHPNAAFPITSGAHERFSCFDCHDPDRGSSIGGANTDCVGCHTGEHSRSRSDDQHNEVSGYQFDPNRPNFCLECHPDGRKDD